MWNRKPSKETKFFKPYVVGIDDGNGLEYQVIYIAIECVTKLPTTLSQ